MWVDEVARSLIAQIQAFLPASIEISFDNGSVCLSGEHLGGALLHFNQIAEQRGARLDNARTAVIALLDFVQDYVVEDTRAAWPPSAPLSSPTTSVSGRRIDGWFGDSSDTAAVHVAVQIPDEIASDR